MTRMSDLLERVTAFRAAFARRQASETVELPGAFAVRDPDFFHSQEHNQLIVHVASTSARGLMVTAGSTPGVSGCRSGFRTTGMCWPP